MFDTLLIIAIILLLLVLVGSLIVAHKRVLSGYNGACPRPKNGDVTLDKACENHLILSNNDEPSQWKIQVSGQGRK